MDGKMTIEDYMKEVYVCNTKNCPHALHRMSVEEYTGALKKQAQDSK